MYLSLDWLRHYVDLGSEKPQDTAYRLTMATAEVEDVEKITRSVKNIIVGRIENIAPIDTGDSGKTINLVTVDTGQGVTESVCGAPNVRVGMKSALALPGTTLAGGITVREQSVYGKKSSGILCSPLELGWGESHAGIIAFPDSLPTGAELGDFVPETDHVIEIDNKSITHRPDLWGHYGFARELAAIYGVELKPLDLADAGLWESNEAFPLRIDDLDGCPGYSCLDIDNLKPAFSPLVLQYRLLAIGLRPINLLVDLTNYIMCEIGQPMHAFDGDRVRDVIVAPFGRKGTFVTLDSMERPMLPEDLMINDHNGPIALAGIMGGENTEILEDTSRMLLESANFNPSRIRRTAVRLNLRSDASIRFEKGQPPYHMGISIRRFVRLLDEAGQKPVIQSKLTGAGDTGDTPRTLTMKAGYIRRTIGMDIPDSRTTAILESLGFGCRLDGDDLHLTIPLHRSARDISIPNDIVEEVARIYGYDNIVPAMPEMKLTSYKFNEELQKQHKVRRFLSLARGYSEAYTYSWYDDNWLRRIGYDPGETFTLMNPSADNNTRMRRDVLPNLLALVETNATHRDRFALYEVGNVFHPENGGCRQAMHAAGITYQSARLGGLQDLFLRIKGTIEELFALVNAGAPKFVLCGSTVKPWCIAGASMDIIVGDTIIGQTGFLTGKLFDVFEKDTQAAWFEIDLDAIDGKRFPDLTYDPIPVYPGSWMDFSIVADASKTYADLESMIGAFSYPILKDAKFLYSYRGKGLADNAVSYTFRFWLGMKDRTLTGDDLNGFREAFLSYLGEQGLSLR